MASAASNDLRIPGRAVERSGLLASGLAARLRQLLALACVFTVIFGYSQAWVAPAVGYTLTAASSPIIRYGFFPTYGASVLLFILGDQAALKMLWRNKLLVVLLALAFASTLWSIDPPATMRRALALAFTSLAGVGMVALWRTRPLTLLIASAFVAITIGSFLLGAAVPSMGRMTELFPGAWRGLWIEKNALASQETMAALIFIATGIYYPRARVLWLGLAALALLLVVLSQSKTGLLCAAAGLYGLLICGAFRRGPLAATVMSWASVAGLVAVAALLIASPELLFRLLGKDATLTGRTAIWGAAWRQLAKRPWTGFGYSVLWDHATGWFPGAWIAKDAKFTAGHAHNGWLETWLGLGLWGLVAWTLYFLQVVARSAVSLVRSEACYLVVPYLIVISIRSMTEVSILNHDDFQWVMFIVIACVAGRRDPDNEPVRVSGPAPARPAWSSARP